jgi:cell wall-associated NlpC family hydrolase
MSNQDFINKIVNGAKKGYQKYGILPSVTIAQAINESGWGNSYLARTDNNLFGIKYNGNHNPNLNISQGTWATDDGGYYTHYNSWDDSIDDHGYFLANNSRYKAAIGLKDASAQVKAIADAGYATESNYYSITMQVLNENNLTQYDNGTYIGGDSSNSNSEQITVEATNYQIVANSEKKGDMIFGRRYRITVSDNSGNALDVSDLHCTFNIEKTILMQPNSSVITIYNLNALTENKIMMSGVRVTVEAGYEGSQFGLIFDGDILQTIREKENGNTYKLTIVALDSDRAINFEIANYSIARGQTARDIIEHIASKASIPIPLGSISDKLKDRTLTRGKVMFGKISDYIQQIAESYDLHFYMDNGELNLVSMDELPDGEIFELNPSSGLIGVPSQTDYGLTGQCLLNPQIKLNSLIHINNSLVRAKQIEINSNNSAPSVSTTSTNSSENMPSVNSTRQAIIAEAKKICDDPNVRYSQEKRGQTIEGITYYDCSLFVKHCYGVAGLDILDITTNQWQQVKAQGLYNIDLQAAIAGDIVFWFDGDGTCYHVAIYGGNNDIYAARTANKAGDEQVSYGPIYGDYVIGRPRPLIDVDGGELPSATNDTNSNTNNSQALFRSLDKDGIYRVIAMTYQGDTRGNDWYINFQTITQEGGVIPSVAS